METQLQGLLEALFPQHNDDEHSREAFRYSQKRKSQLLRLIYLRHYGFSPEACHYLFSSKAFVDLAFKIAANVHGKMSDFDPTSEEELAHSYLCRRARNLYPDPTSPPDKPRRFGKTYAIFGHLAARCFAPPTEPCTVVFSPSGGARRRLEVSLEIVQRFADDVNHSSFFALSLVRAPAGSRSCTT